MITTQMSCSGEVSEADNHVIETTNEALFNLGVRTL